MIPVIYICIPVDMRKSLKDFLACRWYQATKSNNQAMAAKADSLKDEMDEALNKVEICKVEFVLNISCKACFCDLVLIIRLYGVVTQQYSALPRTVVCVCCLYNI